MKEQFEQYASIIEEALLFLGIAPEAARSSQPFNWVLRKGTIETLILIRQVPSPNGMQLMFYALSPIMAVPEDDTTKNSLFAELLSLNHSSPNCCFSEYENKIFLRSSRYIYGLEKDEAVMIITDIVKSSEVIQKKLGERYNMKKVEKNDTAAT